MNIFEKVANFVITRVISVYGGIARKRYLTQSSDVDKISEKLLMNLLQKNRNTEIGKKYDFANIKSIKEYQDKVPYTTYEDYTEYIDRMAKTGEQNLITAEHIGFFAKTSGTTGVTKRIPVVDKTYKSYLKCVSSYFTILTKLMKENGIHTGKGLNTVENETEITEGGIREGFISSYALSKMNVVQPTICIPKEIDGYGDNIDMKYIKARYALQDPDLIYLMSIFMSTMSDLMKYIFDNYQMLVNDIRTGTIDKDVDIPVELRQKLEQKLKPDPKRADQLLKIFLNEPDKGIIRKIWPKMLLVVAIGTGEFAPFTEKMRYYCGDKVTFSFGLYAASEAIMAYATEPEDEDFLMVTDSGFFEFLPADDENARPLLSHELEKGKLYEIIITSASGLYRYRIKDVIRVTGFVGKNPKIQFAYRKQQLINITGVKLTAEHITTAIKGFETELGVRVLDYSLYADTDFAPWRIIAFMEFDEPVDEKDRGIVKEIFDQELTKVNAEYGRMLKIGECSPCAVCSVKKNTYNEYRKQKVKNGASDNQVKTVRIIDDKKKLEFFKQSVEQYF